MSEKAIDYDDPNFNSGVTHTVELLAKELGVTDWVAGDGSEDYDEDLSQTLLNIIVAKGLYNEEDGSWAALPHLRAGREEIAAAIEREYRNFMATGRDREKSEWYGDAADADAVLALFPAVRGEGRVPSDRELWDNGCLTQSQLATWTDSDLSKHSAGIRKTLQFLFARLSSAPPAPAPEGEWREEAIGEINRVARRNRHEGGDPSWNDAVETMRVECIDALPAPPVAEPK